MDTFAKIQNTFRQVFDDDKLNISPETNPAQITDWDSIAHVKLVLTLEEELGIQFTMDEISSMNTVGDIVRAVEAHRESI